MNELISSIPFPLEYLALGFGLVFLLLFIVGGTRKGIISNDDLTLKSERLGLIGRPDRIIKEDGNIWIPVEKKSSAKVQDSHRLQLAVYMILIEDITGKRPPHGYVALRDNSQSKVQNTEKLRACAWAHIEAIKQIKQNPNAHVKATPFPAKCKACGYNRVCTFAKS